MKKTLLTLLAAGIIGLSSCTNNPEVENKTNTKKVFTKEIILSKKQEENKIIKRKNISNNNNNNNK